jgi:hypothetical protein
VRFPKQIFAKENDCCISGYRDNPEALKKLSINGAEVSIIGLEKMHCFSHLSQSTPRNRDGRNGRVIEYDQRVPFSVAGEFAHMVEVHDKTFVDPEETCARKPL